MSTRYYPLYQRGNPPLRIFLPNFWMKLIRSEEPLPPNKVLFQTSIEMTKYDVKNYLEKIYNVPVVEVETTIKMGEITRTPKASLRKDDDYKEALVTLPKGYVFNFPDIFPKQKKSDLTDHKDYKEYEESFKKRNVHSFGIPKWFSG